jgi:hypothetical protein
MPAAAMRRLHPLLRKKKAKGGEQRQRRCVFDKTYLACSIAHLEARALSGACLLLHGHDLHDLILQRAAEEVVNNLVFLHREGEEVDLLKALDLALHRVRE